MERAIRVPAKGRPSYLLQPLRSENGKTPGALYLQHILGVSWKNEGLNAEKLTKNHVRGPPPEPGCPYWSPEGAPLHRGARAAHRCRARGPHPESQDLFSLSPLEQCHGERPRAERSFSIYYYATLSPYFHFRLRHKKLPG